MTQQKGTQWKEQVIQKRNTMNKDTREGKKLCKGQRICTKTFSVQIGKIF